MLMKTNGYNVPQVANLTRVTLSRALAAGAGYAEGDILSQTEIVNQLTGATIATYWKNEDTETALAAAPVLTDVESLDSLRIVVGSEILPFAAVAAGLATIPANANIAELHVWGGDIVYNYDGSAPNDLTSDGYRENDGNTFELEGAQEIANFQVKGILTAVGNIKVTYIKEYYVNA